MRLLQHRVDGVLRAALSLDGVHAYDLDDLGSGIAAPAGGWTTRRALAAGPDALGALAAAAADGTHEPVGAIGDLELGPPIHDPDKILCLGLNYRDHAAETGMAAPAAPMLFAKFRNALAGPNDDVVMPPVTSDVDYEAELAVVIGRRCRDVAPEDAMAVIGGAMAFNDVSARDLQMATSQWGAGKALDGFAPCGPTLVLVDELPDLQDLAIAARVNGEVVQSSRTSMMIFSIAETIAFVTSLMTLEPGDVIATGTPAGVGMSREPRVSLADGDVVEVEIERIGTLANRFVASVRVAS